MSCRQIIAFVCVTTLAASCTSDWPEDSSQSAIVEPVEAQVSNKVKTSVQDIEELKFPDLTIKAKSEIEFRNGVVKIFDLNPQHDPSGSFFLKSLRNGKMKAIQTFKFKRMNGPGVIALMISESDIELSFKVKCAQSSHGKVVAKIPDIFRKSETTISTPYLSSNGEENILWSTLGFVGEEPSEWTFSDGTIEDCIAGSKKYPQIQMYLVTGQLETSELLK